MEFEPAVATPSRFGLKPDPLMVGLSMVNWLFLMLLMSGLMLAGTISGHTERAGNSTDISTSATH